MQQTRWRCVVYWPVLVAVALVSTPASAGGPDGGEQSRIIGGQEIRDQSQSMSTVALFISAGATSLCSGVVIAPTWVITAAHCNETFKIKFVDPSVENGKGKRVPVSEFFTVPGGKSDLALLKTSEPITAPSRPWSRRIPAEGEQFEQYGFGQTSGGDGLASPWLKKATGKMTGWWDEKGGPVDKFIKIQSVSGQPWKGDSGGPLIQNGVTIGAIWATNGSQSSSGESYYSALGKYADWIVQTTGVKPIEDTGVPEPAPTPGVPTSAPVPTRPVPTPTAAPSPGGPTSAPLPSPGLPWPPPSAPR